MVALVGVQSNQFPRALDIGRQFRKQGVTVAVGGFHVSGCIAMLPELPPDLKEAQALGMILYAGEGENRLAEFLKDVDSGKPKPVYNYLNDMPDMAAAAIPVLPRPVVTKVAGHYTSFDAGTRLPVPVQLLHHHQRPGAQVALSHARRRRGDRARQRGAGRHALFRHG